jgi:hypothetical protein
MTTTCVHDFASAQRGKQQIPFGDDNQKSDGNGRARANPMERQGQNQWQRQEPKATEAFLVFAFDQILG